MVQQLPDAEILFRTWALSQTPITDLVSTRIATRLPTSGTMPFLVYTMLGGAPIGGESLIYEATMFIDAYAGKYASSGTKGQPDFAGAFNLANTTVEQSFDYSPTKLTSSGGEIGVIHGFYNQSGPSRVEEPDLGLARYNIEVVMVYGAAT